MELVLFPALCVEEGKLSMVKACLSPSAVLHVSPVWYPSRKPVLGGTYILIRIKSWATSSTNFSTGISIIHPTEVDEETGIVTFRDLEAGEYEIVEDIRPKKSGPPYISGTVTMPYGQERKVYVLYGNLYDTHLKILFSRTFFLARVVRLAVKSIPLEAPEHRDNNSALLSYNRHAFVGMPTEDHSLTEGLVVYDLPFRMHFPNWYIYEGKVLTLFDLDFMTRDAKFREVILPRCFYYIGRMISSQKGVLFINDKYEDIRKVHSIWLIIDAADKNRQNTVKHLPKETVTETMNEILESIMLSTLQGPISTGFVKKVREAVSLVFAEELVKIVEELIEIIRARVYQNDPSVPPMPTKDKIMEALAERQEDVERVRTFLEATIITLGPYKDAKDDDVKFLDILIYERFNETQRSQILKDELGVLIPEELNKEVTHLMTLAEQLTSAGYSKGYTAGHTAGHSEGSTETAGQFSKFMESYMSGKNRDEAAVKAGLDLKESSVQKFLSQLPPVSQFPSPPVP